MLKYKIPQIVTLTPYWGFIPLTDDQFQNVLKGGNVNENIVVD